MERQGTFRHRLRLILASVLSLIMVGVMLPATSANAIEASPAGDCIVSDDIEVDHELQANLDKIMSVLPYFRFTEDGQQLDMTLSREDLQTQFGFTDDQYEFLSQKVLHPDIDAHATVGTGKQKTGMATMRRAMAGCSGVYMSYVDLTAGFAAALFAASQVSPAALAAVFTALSSVFGGPVGAAAAAGIGLLGASFFADLGAKIVGAVAKRKGVCVTARWGWPPLQSEIR